MPVFSPNAPAPYKTLCGQIRSDSGFLYNMYTGDKHEHECNDCIAIQREINAFTDVLVQVYNSGKIINPGPISISVRNRFGVSANRVRQEMAHARARKLKNWGKPQ